jgi:hypothetical protein
MAKSGSYSLSKTIMKTYPIGSHQNCVCQGFELHHPHQRWPIIFLLGQLESVQDDWKENDHSKIHDRQFTKNTLYDVLL